MLINEKLIGCEVSFTYHSKPRSGQIEEVRPVYIILFMEEKDEDGQHYKSFSKNKISNFKVTQ